MLSGCWLWRTLWYVDCRLFVHAPVFSPPSLFPALSLRGVSGPSVSFPSLRSFTQAVLGCCGIYSYSRRRFRSGKLGADCWSRKSSEPSSHQISHPRGARMKSSELRAHQISVGASLGWFLRAELSSNGSSKLSAEVVSQSWRKRSSASFCCFLILAESWERY